MSPDLKPDSVSFPKLVSQLAQVQHGRLTGHLTLRPATLQAQAPYGTARLQVAPQTRCDLDLHLGASPKPNLVHLHSASLRLSQPLRVHNPLQACVQTHGLEHLFAKMLGWALTYDLRGLDHVAGKPLVLHGDVRWWGHRRSQTLSRRAALVGQAPLAAPRRHLLPWHRQPQTPTGPQDFATMATALAPKLVEAVKLQMQAHGALPAVAQIASCAGEALGSASEEHGDASEAHGNTNSKSLGNTGGAYGNASKAHGDVSGAPGDTSESPGGPGEAMARLGETLVILPAGPHSFYLQLQAQMDPSGQAQVQVRSLPPPTELFASAALSLGIEAQASAKLSVSPAGHLHVSAQGHGELLAYAAHCTLRPADAPVGSGIRILAGHARPAAPHSVALRAPFAFKSHDRAYELTGAGVITGSAFFLNAGQRPPPLGNEQRSLQLHGDLQFVLRSRPGVLRPAVPGLWTRGVVSLAPHNSEPFRWQLNLAPGTLSFEPL
jgi:hypothetical protein